MGRLTGIDIRERCISTKDARPWIRLEPVVMNVEGVGGVRDDSVGEVAVSARLNRVAHCFPGSTSPIQALFHETSLISESMNPQVEHGRE